MYQKTISLLDDNPDGAHGKAGLGHGRGHACAVDFTSEHMSRGWHRINYTVHVHKKINQRTSLLLALINRETYTLMTAQSPIVIISDDESGNERVK